MVKSCGKCPNEINSHEKLCYDCSNSEKLCQICATNKNYTGMTFCESCLVDWHGRCSDCEGPMFEDKCIDHTSH